MKKVLIGCGIGCLVIILVMVGLVTWIGVKASQIIKPAKDVIVSLEKTNQDFSFTPPEGNKLDPSRFAAYMTIRQALMPELIDKIQSVKKDIDTIKSSNSGSFTDAINIGKGIVEAFVAIGEKHVSLLNENQMSSDEYRYITQVIHATIRNGAANNEACEELNTQIEGLFGQDESLFSRDELAVTLPLRGIEYVESNGELITQNKDKLADPPAALLADLTLVWINQEARAKASPGTR